MPKAKKLAIKDTEQRKVRSKQNKIAREKSEKARLKHNANKAKQVSEHSSQVKLSTSNKKEMRKKDVSESSEDNDEEEFEDVDDDDDDDDEKDGENVDNFDSGNESNNNNDTTWSENEISDVEKLKPKLKKLVKDDTKSKAYMEGLKAQNMKHGKKSKEVNEQVSSSSINLVSEKERITAAVDALIASLPGQNKSHVIRDSKYATLVEEKCGFTGPLVCSILYLCIDIYVDIALLCVLYTNIAANLSLILVTKLVTKLSLNQ